MRAIAVAALAAAAGTASAMFVEFPEAPVERLLRNVDRALEEAPTDPHLLYLKGRTHALAYAKGAGAVGRSEFGDPVAGSDGKMRRDDENALPRFSLRNHDRLEFEGQADDARLAHLREGIRRLRSASVLAMPPADPGPRTDDERPLIFLGLAWLLDDGSRFAPKLGHPESVEPIVFLGEAERARIDGWIAALGAPTEAERDAAYVALRSSFHRCWSRLVAQRDAKDATIRAKVGELLTRWWQDQALDAYRRALELALPRDIALAKHRVGGVFAVSEEAGRAILRLLDGVPDSEAVRQERSEVERALERVKSRSLAVTPVLFPVSAPRPLADLLPPGRTSRFDLAGDGIPRLWPWPSADAAFLVWAPDPSEPVTSGRDLFGARTWWIFWCDGYEPLSMLDDDDDGRLAGAELEGIGVWRDLDGDGTSDAGEVSSAAAFGLEWIAVRATRTEDGVPAADLGVGLRDGTARPTYDWTPTSLPEPAPQE